MQVPRAASNPVITLLAASPYENDHALLHTILSHSNWVMYTASTCDEALSVIHREVIPVVIWDAELRGGNWQFILDKFAAMPHPPKLIVSSRLADERLWADVLQAGAYDLLQTPFDSHELFRVVSLAWHSWHRQWKTAKPAPRLSTPAGVVAKHLAAARTAS
jgi:DNA-binding NtrC family response regulator